MHTTKILVIGASGQIGTDLTLALRKQYGTANIIAADLREPGQWFKETGPFEKLNVLDNYELSDIIGRHSIAQIYLLVALLSATGEQRPREAWELNMQSLLQVLEIAKERKIRLFWPSSIAIFGPDSPRINCPQQTIIEPATVYGISKYAGECWCQYYHNKYGVDVRSVRYPGLISYRSPAGGGTTDYAVDIFHHAITQNRYVSFLKPDTILPMMYMPDATRAAMELMEAPDEKVKIRLSYNIAAMSFSPRELATEIQQNFPGFNMQYKPDYRQAIADMWPSVVDDSTARRDWGWQPRYNIKTMTADMIEQLYHVHFLTSNHS